MAIDYRCDQLIKLHIYPAVQKKKAPHLPLGICNNFFLSTGQTLQLPKPTAIFPLNKNWNQKHFNGTAQIQIQIQIVLITIQLNHSAE